MWLFLCFSEVYDQLVGAGLIVPQPEKDPPTVPMDYKWAQELGLVRKPASIMSSISDERGEELLYAGMPISDVFKVCMRACVCRMSYGVATPCWWSYLPECCATVDRGTVCCVAWVCEMVA